jgi:hypothetical protein
MSRGLGGKTVTFTLGSQGCTATTNGSGTAACNIPKLSQKPGSYPTTISFAGDGDYLPSTSGTAFKIG